MQLHEEKDWFDGHQVNVAIVTFEQPWRAAAYADECQMEWPILVDPTHGLYAAYGMSRGSRQRVLGVSNWLAYLKLIVRGRRVRKPTDDIYQLGGDVLIDENGIVRFHFVSGRPIDRPSVAAIKQVVEDL